MAFNTLLVYSSAAALQLDNMCTWAIVWRGGVLMELLLLRWGLKTRYSDCRWLVSNNFITQSDFVSITENSCA